MAFRGGLRPARLQEFGLHQALESFVADCARIHGVSAECHQFNVAGRLAHPKPSARRWFRIGEPQASRP